ncbi:MAG: phage major capsid protein, partial [Muribaculum sp.]|nr:phage major capsid protein [Muribaculum sp.]
MSKQITKSDLGISFEGMPTEQRIFMEKNLDAMCTVINKAFAGHATPEEVEAKFKSLNDTLQGFNGEQYAQLIKDNQTLSEQLTKMAETIDKIQKKGVSMKSLSKFEESIDAMIDSERFKEFAEGQTRKSGVFEGFTLKDIVSMSDNYEGELLITQQQPRVVSSVNNKRLHLRDVITVLTGDPQYPNLAFTRVYDFDRNARYVTENGMLPQSSLKLKEENYTTKRLGTHIHISKRMLKSRAFIKSWIINMLPEAVYMAEDWNMLFGDGNGENLDGIANTKGVESIESIINGAIVSGVAGSIKSVTPFNNGKDTIIEFTNPVDAIHDGMMITLAKATATELNKANPIVKMNDRQVLLRGVALA